ncbi:MAG: sigma 54-interacting transcriptional regulator [Planctomycetota bacterium]
MISSRFEPADSKWFSQLITLLQRCGGNFDGGLVQQAGDTWQRQCWHGEVPAKLEDWVADEAAEVGHDVTELPDGWLLMVVPLAEFSVDNSRLGPAQTGGDCVVVGRWSGITSSRQHFADLARMIAGLAAVHDSHRVDHRRLWQMTEVLSAAADWQHIDQVESLLSAIATCACKVVGCQRASIFLWERRRRLLIGRPAIGIEGGVLEVEDNQGIVGEVLQSGEPKVWTCGGIDDDRLNRRIDQTQQFETQSLLAVPMTDSSAKTIGVFELINKESLQYQRTTRASKTGEAVVPSFDEADTWTLMQLARHAAAAIVSQQSRTQLSASRDRLIDQAASENEMVGSCDAIKSLRESASRIAGTNMSVLILGSNGTGKEILARHLHYNGERRSGPFVAVNCAALVESLLESELFGHEKGAFTDASTTRVGKFESAVGGTLFLDEIGDLSPAGQAKLLRVLQEKMIVRVGGTQSIPVDVRVIAATNQPLQQLIEKGRFREDLFFRLNVASLTLPPLRQRGDDIIELANHFLDVFCRQIGRRIPTWEPAAKQALLSHPWPGNIRELRNTIERVCYLAQSDSISTNDLMLWTTSISTASGAPESGVARQPSSIQQGDDGFTNEACGGGTDAAHQPSELNEATRLFQIDHVQRMIRLHDGNVTAAAAAMGLHRSNLYRKMRQLGMDPSSKP